MTESGDRTRFYVTPDKVTKLRRLHNTLVTKKPTSKTLKLNYLLTEPTAALPSETNKEYIRRSIRMIDRLDLGSPKIKLKLSEPVSSRQPNEATRQCRERIRRYWLVPKAELNLSSLDIKAKKQPLGSVRPQPRRSAVSSHCRARLFPQVNQYSRCIPRKQSNLLSGWEVD